MVSDQASNDEGLHGKDTENQVLLQGSQQCSGTAIIAKGSSQQLIVGYAVVDRTYCCGQVCQFNDDSSFSTLESLVVQTEPGILHVIFAAGGIGDRDVARVRDVAATCGVEVVVQTSNIVTAAEVNGAINSVEMKIPAPIRAELVRSVRQTSFRRIEREWDAGVERHTLALLALCGSLRLCTQRQETTVSQQIAVESLKPSGFVRMDRAAFNALNLLPQKGGPRRGFGSLFAFLNRTRTSGGEKRLQRWLCQPATDIVELQQRLDIVDLFTRHPQLRGVLQQQHLRRLPNLDLLATKLHAAATTQPQPPRASVCSLSEIVQFSDAVTQLRNVVEALKSLEASESGHGCSLMASVGRRFTKPLEKLATQLQRLQELVRFSVDADELEYGHCVVKRSFDPILEQLSAERDEVRQLMNVYCRELEAEVGLQQSRRTSMLAGGSNPVDGRDVGGAIHIVEGTTKDASGGHGSFVLRVSKDDQRAIENAPNRENFIQIRINKAEYFFTTKKFVSMSGVYSKKLQVYEQAQQELSRRTVSAASSYWHVAFPVAELLSQLDVLLAFAEVCSACATTRYVRPTLVPPTSNCSRLRIDAGRHPLVEMQLEQQRLLSRPLAKSPSTGPPSSTAGGFVGNSTRMCRFEEGTNNCDDDDKLDGYLHIITGPNTGGKSTYLRQVAMICVLAQIGCFVPCNQAQLPLLDAIYCRVGASDDQLRGVSTFFAEMIEAAAITRTATKHSLVLVDELGRGTSTANGFGLAWGFARFLAEHVRCFCLFATHLHELAALERCTAGVKNYHMAVSLKPPSTLPTNPTGDGTTEALEQPLVVATSGHDALSEAVLLFVLRPGPVSVSFGLQVALASGIPAAVLQAAHWYATWLEFVELCFRRSVKHSLQPESTQQDQLVLHCHRKALNMPLLDALDYGGVVSSDSPVYGDLSGVVDDREASLTVAETDKTGRLTDMAVDEWRLLEIVEAAVVAATAAATAHQRDRSASLGTKNKLDEVALDECEGTKNGVDEVALDEFIRVCRCSLGGATLTASGPTTSCINERRGRSGTVL